MKSLWKMFGNAYTSAYWCLFPATPQEDAVPRLQDCQDNLQDRLEKLRQRETELKDELMQLRNKRDRSKLRRVWMERQSIVRDVKITENTLWTIERQIALFERSDLDTLIINSMRASNAALQDLAEKSGYSINNVEDITETLQQRMQEANEITESVSSVLQTGIDQDMECLEKELEMFLNGDDSVLDTQVDFVDEGHGEMNGIKTTRQRMSTEKGSNIAVEQQGSGDYGKEQKDIEESSEMEEIGLLANSHAM